MYCIHYMFKGVVLQSVHPNVVPPSHDLYPSVYSSMYYSDYSRSSRHLVIHGLRQVN